jgi:multiple sugar transport system permease protein
MGRAGLSYGLALISLVVFLGPFLYMIGLALKPQSEVYSWPPQVLPAHPDWGNFARAWGQERFSRYFLNSTVVTIVSVVTNVLLGSMAGYAFARLRFPGRNLLFLAVVATLMIPTAALIIPLFLMLKDVPLTPSGGWLNTYQGIILPTAVTGFSIFLMRQYLAAIPKDLDEQAEIDGCNPWQTYWFVIMPLCRPALAIIAVFTSLLRWNDYLLPLVVANNPDLYTIQIGLISFVKTHQIIWNLMMAAALIASAPMLLLYALLQPFFQQSLGALGTGVRE